MRDMAPALDDEAVLAALAVELRASQTQAETDAVLVLIAACIDRIDPTPRPE